MKNLKTVLFVVILCQCIVGFHANGAPPYQVSLDPCANSICYDGAIIAAEWVVTAAVCGNPTNVIVDSDGFKAGLLKQSVSYPIKRRINHPSFNNKTLEYNICLLKLSKKIILSPTTQLINLVLPKFELSHGVTAVVYGWIRIQVGITIVRISVPLEVQIMDTKQCTANYKDDGQVIKSEKFCAVSIYGKSEICSNNPGAPFVFNGQLAGIASSSCGVFSGIPRDFIMTEMSKNN